MGEPTVTAALGRLRRAADTARAGWRPERWRRVDGPGPDEYGTEQLTVLGPVGGFVPHLAIEPGGALTVECDIDLPAEIAGVPMAGEPLEVFLWTLFPCVATHVGADGATRLLMDDPQPPVAAGPALLRVVDTLGGGSGGNGAFRLALRAGENHTYRSWNWWNFTTPSLRARFEQLDVAWARLWLASELATTDVERKAVAAAAMVVPDDVLGSDAAALDAAFDELATALAPVAARAEAIDVHCIGHSHIDMNWLWRWPDTVEVVRRDMRSVLALMDEFPEMRFTHSQPATYEIVRRHEPELFERIVDHVASGRWEPATCQWVEGDTNLAGHEGTARQVLEAVTWTREHLGVSPSVFLAPDTFGHAGNLPQVAASGGARVYYHHRANPSQRTGEWWPAYWWEGQDGTRLLALTTFSYNGAITAGELAGAAVNATRAGLDAGCKFFGVGDHGGGPTRESLEALRRLGSLAGLPRARCSTLTAYADAVVAAGVALPVARGESPTVFEGCYTTHADTKRMNREGEDVLTTAGALAALAGVDGAELVDAWRTVLFNQFHDILDGSAIGEVYADQAVDHEGVLAAAATVVERALDVLTEGAPAGAVVVTNPLPSTRREVVEVPAGDAVPSGDGPLVALADDGTVTAAQRTADGGACFVASVPGYATTLHELRAATADEVATLLRPLTRDDDRRWWRIETDLFAVKVRKADGIVVSLVDRRTGRDLCVHPLFDFRPELGIGALHVVDERPHDMSAWDVRDQAVETAVIGVSDAPGENDATEVLEAGPVRLVLRVVHAVRSSTVEQRMTFHRDLDRIDVAYGIDWHEPGNDEVGVPGLKASFAVSTRRPQAWFETPFGAVERAADGMESPALRWAAVVGEQGGIAVLNDSRYGHDVLGGRLRVSLVRTAYDPDPASDLGHHDVSLSVVPLAADWRDADLAARAAAVGQPLLVRVGDGSTAGTPVGPLGWRPEVRGAGVAVSGFAPARREPGATVLRLFEATGRTVPASVDGLPDGAIVWEATVTEDRVRRLLVHDGRVDLRFTPWQVRTLLVERP